MATKIDDLHTLTRLWEDKHKELHLAQRDVSDARSLGRPSDQVMALSVRATHLEMEVCALARQLDWLRSGQDPYKRPIEGLCICGAPADGHYPECQFEPRSTAAQRPL